MKKHRFLLYTASALFFILSVISACSPKNTAQKEETAPSANTVPALPNGAINMPPYAIIIAGKTPLWFEYAKTGLPKQISRIEDAALNDFVPWTAARHTTGLIFFNAADESAAGQTSIAAAVNRFGFLALCPPQKNDDAPAADEVLFYVFEETAYFPNYTASAPFNLNGYPAALLSFNDFFTASAPTASSKNAAPAAAAPPMPASQAPGEYSFAIGKNGLFKPEIPVFMNLTSAGLWNICNFFYGKQGLWYIKAQKPDGKFFYGQTVDIASSSKIEEISEALYYKENAPAKADALPPPLRALLEKALVLCSIDNWVLYVYEEHGKRAYSGQTANTAAAKMPPELFALYNNEDAGNAVLLVNENEGKNALILRNVAGVNGAAGTGIYVQALPMLPENFFWTGAGIVDSGNDGDAAGTLIAFWEEREAWNIGAAGFMLIKAENQQ
ncbi:MAG: hypothetical protein LBG72_05260 [Spirochaetaceae bacterium]|jgi:hypothetical protein|nr:hypothetical protein [Spirochaetaceae bacterium]